MWVKRWYRWNWRIWNFDVHCSGLFSVFVTLHAEVRCCRGWVVNIFLCVVRFQPVHGYDFAALALPSWVRGDFVEGVVDLLNHRPWSGVVPVEFPRHTDGVDRGEQPDLGIRFEELPILVVEAALADNSL